jgi:glycerophosphoryl diester phosphodiesterase
VVIEVKPPTPQHRADIARGVAELVRRLDLYPVCLGMSFDLPWIQELRALDPRVRTGALVDAKWLAREGNDCGRAVRKLVEVCHPDVIAAPKDITDDAWVKAVHAHGRKYFVWTVNQPDDIVRMAQLDVDAIITDRPDVALRVLGQGGSISSVGDVP